MKRINEGAWGMMGEGVILGGRVMDVAKGSCFRLNVIIIQA